jgi:hypothetical protein
VLKMIFNLSCTKGTLLVEQRTGRCSPIGTAGAAPSLFLSRLLRPLSANPNLLRVLLLVLRYLGLVAGHVELGGPLPPDDRQPLFRRGLEPPLVDPAVLVLGFHVQYVLHVQLKEVSTSSPNHAGSLVHFKPAPRPVPDDEIMDVVVGIRVSSL